MQALGLVRMPKNVKSTLFLTFHGSFLFQIFFLILEFFNFIHSTVALVDLDWSNGGFFIQQK